jgi:hypothetical protein
VGHHGPTDILVERLNPMLLKYKDAAYFSGHDHDMQHLDDGQICKGIVTVTDNALSQSNC